MIVVKFTWFFIFIFCIFIIICCFCLIRLLVIHLFFLNIIVDILIVSIHFLRAQPQFKAILLLIIHHYGSKGSLGKYSLPRLHSLNMLLRILTVTLLFQYTLLFSLNVNSNITATWKWCPRVCLIKSNS